MLPMSVVRNLLLISLLVAYMLYRQSRFLDAARVKKMTSFSLEDDDDRTEFHHVKTVQDTRIANNEYHPQFTARSPPTPNAVRKGSNNAKEKQSHAPAVATTRTQRPVISVNTKSPTIRAPEQNNSSAKFRVQPSDSMYNIHTNVTGWDGPPIVVEKYKLLFFTTAKTGCTVWNQLFRRIQGFENWQKVSGHPKMLPWNPAVNGLKYLYDYNMTYATHMMTDPSWTRAIGLRDPLERFVSAYLDKVIRNDEFLAIHCCSQNQTCIDEARVSPSHFLSLAKSCPNAHWNPQNWRMPLNYWKQINFVAHMDTLQEDAKTLLQRVGAWDEFGAEGWGGGHIFSSAPGQNGRSHATGAHSKIAKLLTPELEQELKHFYAEDYSNPVILQSIKHAETQSAVDVSLSYSGINPDPASRIQAWQV